MGQQITINVAKGLELSVPGKPVKPHHPQPTQVTTTPSQRTSSQPAPDLAAAHDAIKQWEADSRKAQKWLEGASREDLVEILEGLQNGLRPKQQTATTASIAAKVRQVLRKRKEEKKPRDFIRFFYGHRAAGEMDLPAILRDPVVYKEHPEPDVAAAIMVVHRFAPQIASHLFNYKDWSMDPRPLEPSAATGCPCCFQTLEGVQTTADGHVMDTDPAKLSSPWLRPILAFGKKFRLQQPLSSILPRLREGL